MKKLVMINIAGNVKMWGVKLVKKLLKIVVIIDISSKKSYKLMIAIFFFLVSCMQDAYMELPLCNCVP